MSSIASIVSIISSLSPIISSTFAYLSSVKFSKMTIKFCCISSDCIEKDDEKDNEKKQDTPVVKKANSV